MNSDIVVLRPAMPDEKDLFYSNIDGQDAALGTVGHLRIDFGHGEEFWHTWWPHNDDRLNTPPFKAALQHVVETLRGSVLKNLREMSRYCCQHPEGEISESVYGYVAELGGYRFCLRCTPRPGDYQGYLYCYRLSGVERSA